MTLPDRPLDTQLPLLQIHVRPLQGGDLATAEPRLTSQQNDQERLLTAPPCRIDESLGSRSTSQC
jgi:hypothetical protein